MITTKLERRQRHHGHDGSKSPSNRHNNHCMSHLYSLCQMDSMTDSIPEKPTKYRPQSSYIHVHACPIQPGFLKLIVIINDSSTMICRGYLLLHIEQITLIIALNSPSPTKFQQLHRGAYYLMLSDIHMYVLSSLLDYLYAWKFNPVAYHLSRVITDNVKTDNSEANTVINPTISQPPSNCHQLAKLKYCPRDFTSTTAKVSRQIPCSKSEKAAIT